MNIKRFIFASIAVFIIIRIDCRHGVLLSGWYAG